MKNTVSIIMPAHNSACTIRESINSVIAQTHKNWELIIIDDCSTDDNVAIVKEYVKTDERIRLLHTDKSYGKPFYPRNIGIKNAQGRYIALLDSDDIWLPTKLERQLSFFDDKNIAIVFSNYEKFSDENTYNNNRIIKARKIVNYKTALFGNPIGNLTAIFDTKKVGKPLYESVGHEDYLFWLRILQKGYIAKNTCSVEARYRVGTKSVSSNKKHAARWVWIIFRQKLNMNLLQAVFHFIGYAINGFLKYL